MQPPSRAVPNLSGRHPLFPRVPMPPISDKLCVLFEGSTFAAAVLGPGMVLAHANSHFLSLLRCQSLDDAATSAGFAKIRTLLAPAESLNGLPSPPHSCLLTFEDGSGLHTSIAEIPFTNEGSGSIWRLLLLSDTSSPPHLSSPRQTQRILEEFMANMPGLAFIKDERGRVLFGNQRLRELNQTTGSIVGKHTWEIIPGLDRTLAERSDREVAARGGAVELEVKLGTPGNEQVFCALKFPVHVDQHTTLYGGIAIDITDRKRAELLLRESESKYRLLFENAGDAIMIVGTDGRILSANAASYRQYEYSPGALSSLHVEQLDCSDLRLSIPQIIAGVLERGEACFCTCHRTATGRTIQVEVNARRIPWEGHSAILCHLRDLTSIREAEENRLIREKLEATGVLAGGIAHDFNNLLTSILLGIEMTQMSLLPSNPLQHDMLQTAVEAVRAAQELSKRLITFANGGSPVLERLNLTALLSHALAPLQAETAGQIVLDLPPADLVIHADPGQLTQLVQNLARNALEASPKHGRVTLRARSLSQGPETETPMIEIVVSDSGIGIAEENIARVFDPYFSTKERGDQKGMGLGLTLCRSIVQRHQGSIAIESRVGRGTQVTVCLPLGAQTKSHRDHEFAPLRATQRVLVMDDDEFMRRTLQRTLALAGFNATLCTRGEEALQLARQAENENRPFDTCLLGLLNRTGLGAVETLRALRHVTPHLRAVVMSGLADHEALLHPREYGFDASLAKPFTNQQLIASITARAPEQGDSGPKV